MQSPSQIITTNKPTSSFFYRPDALPVAQPTVSKQWREISHSMDLLTPSSPGGLPTLSLTTNSSWLPWGRVAMALISPLMPVPHVLQICTKTNQLLLVTHPRPAQNLSKFFDTFAIIGSQGLKVSKCMSMPILSSHFVLPIICCQWDKHCYQWIWIYPVSQKLCHFGKLWFWQARTNRDNFW